ncbi:hypothetical protein I0Q91_11395 [Halanaerobiaceae bacterium Z-7014]|uniref:Uncharacterized protein n=1 Tax=Halonatronomonas betaini TaxID=2778430 RepID=A0A931AT61_9FIRM|nr:hypothetical protein [Halonatronomonas betaini]MBF8437689.1 hypothetical protein [Halonatronomonas betaini]
MGIFKYYIYVLLPILIALIASFRWNGAGSFFPYIMMFLFFAVNEIGNFFISDNQLYGMIFYLNHFRYESEIQPLNKGEEFKFIKININHNILGLALILLSIVIYMFLVFFIELDLFYYFNILILLFLYYIVPRLELIKKDYLNIGVISALLSGLLFLSFYFIDLTNVKVIVFNLLFIILLLEFNIFLFLSLADNYLIESKYKLEFYRTTKKYNYIYGIILLMAYSLFAINLTLTNNLIWIIPLFSLPYIFYLFSNFTKMVNQGKISLNRLKAVNWMNIKIFTGGSVIIILLLLLDIIF